MKIIGSLWEKGLNGEPSIPPFLLASGSLCVLTKHLEGYHNFLYKESVLFLIQHFY